MPVKKRQKKTVEGKPVLVKVGKSLIDPNDVAAITKVNIRGLYVIKLKSQPNAEYPIWAKEHELGDLLNSFRIIASDCELEDPEFGDDRPPF